MPHTFLSMFSGGTRLAASICVVGSLVGVAPSAGAQSPGNGQAHAPVDSPRLAAHRRLFAEFLEASKGGPAAALAFARERVKRTGLLSADDPARADALELMANAEMQAERFVEALPLATEVVRIRRLTRPPEHELLALALGLDATLLFAADRGEESDAMLREALGEWRQSFGANDVRMAQKLELYAESVQKGFGRRAYVIELLREAVAIRAGDPTSARGKLAETLVELSIHEMSASEYAECDAHLARAEALLKALIAAPRSDDEDKALLVQALILRSGIAGKLGHVEDAVQLIQAAQSIKFADRPTRVEMDLLIREAMVTQYDLAEQVDAAIVAETGRVQVIASNADLFKEGSPLDPLMRGDALLSLGKLYLEKGDLVSARAALGDSHRLNGDSEELLFALAELDKRAGDEVQSLQHYRAGLKLRKESATEVTVLFGTNRAPVPGSEEGRFGGDPGTSLRFGSASVLVPGAQFTTTTKLRPKVEPAVPVGSATDPARLLIRARHVLSEPAFRSRVETSMKAARLVPGTALVFVHGFNVSFDDALKRGAQLARDLNFDGPMFVFSWPSQGTFWRYGTDRSRAEAAVDSLVAFLNEVAVATAGKHIHVMAHSMGNRVLLPGLVKVFRDTGSPARQKIGEIILAAPAVPERDFSAWIDDLTAHGGSRITLYASAVDRALQVGWFREGITTFAGYSVNGVPLLHAGVQSIDITKAASGEIRDLNHDVFASNPVMSEDIRQILQNGSQRVPESRLPGLLVRRERAGSQPYWAYVAAGSGR